jgi:hypothetical protein
MAVPRHCSQPLPTTTTMSTTMTISTTRTIVHDHDNSTSSRREFHSLAYPQHSINTTFMICDSQIPCHSNRQTWQHFFCTDGELRRLGSPIPAPAAETHPRPPACGGGTSQPTRPTGHQQQAACQNACCCCLAPHAASSCGLRAVDCAAEQPAAQHACCKPSTASLSKLLIRPPNALLFRAARASPR